MENDVKKVRGRPFQKGNKANPRGALAHDLEKRAANKLFQQQINDESLRLLLTLSMGSQVEELKRIYDDPAASIITHIAAQNLLNARKTGNWEAVEKMLIRVLGKPKETIDINAQVASVSAQITVDQYKELRKQFYDEYG